MSVGVFLRTRLSEPFHQQLATEERLAQLTLALEAVVPPGQASYDAVLTAPSLSPRKTTAGIAMAIPGGALIGGALYAGTLVYEHREALGQAANTAWDALREWVA